jgi:cellulose synthase (UDP-forming)
VVSDYYGGRWVNLIYASINVVLATYAILAYVGLWNSLVDIWANVVDFLYPMEAPGKRRASVAPVAQSQPIPEWELLLHYGREDPAHQHAALSSRQGGS